MLGTASCSSCLRGLGEYTIGTRYNRKMAMGVDISGDAAAAIPVRPGRVESANPTTPFLLLQMRLVSPDRAASAGG